MKKPETINQDDLKEASETLQTKKQRRRVHTKIIDDVFTDAIEMVKPRFEIDYEAHLDRLWEANPEIFQRLKNANTLDAARESIFSYLEYAERLIFYLGNDLHILEKALVRQTIRTFKSIIGPINEHRTGFSALESLWKLAMGKRGELIDDISVGFINEFINLFRGVIGKSNVYFESEEAKKGIPEFLRLEGQEAAEVRTEILDEMGATIQKYFRKYPSGLEHDVMSWRKENKERILRYYNGSESDWHSYAWQLKHVMKNAEPLLELIELTAEQQNAIKKAVKHKIPFGITPYYLSLMDHSLSIGFDHGIRAQVIPPPDYVDIMAEHRSERGTIFDFMGEHDTSPIDLVTRRYPGIAILKPFNTCAQICVYCQRNWEIDQVLDPHALASRQSIAKALTWFDDHQSIGDILITGGDPMIMKDDQIRNILEELSRKEQIYRIRIGTRTPVVLPMRWTDKIVQILSEFHEPGNREITVVTHFEHSYNYIDVPIYDYLEEMASRGENIRDYRTIWFYY